MRPSADARSPPVLRLTSPRCHFHAIASRSFGSIGAKHPVMKVSTKVCIESKPSALCRPSRKKSVLHPITVHSLAWRLSPAATSADEPYLPPLNPGSDVIASESVSVKTKSFSVVGGSMGAQQTYEWA